MLKNTTVDGVLKLTQTPLVPAITNTTEILLRDPVTNGIIARTFDQLIGDIYTFRCVDEDIFGNPNIPNLPKRSPVWANKPGVLYTMCPSDLKVGIATDNPTSTLHVNGNGFIASSLTVDGAQTNNGTLQVARKLTVLDGGSFTKALTIGNKSNIFGALSIDNEGQFGAGISIDAKGNPNQFNKLVYMEYTEPTTEIFKVQNTINNKTNYLLSTDGHMFISNNVGKKLIELETTGKLKTREIVVEATEWPDYVFKPSYQLKPISEVKLYIEKNGHLPNVPSAAEVEEKGMNVEETSKAMLEKIEELTLYLIQQQEEINALKLKLKQIEQKK